MYDYRMNVTADAKTAILENYTPAEIRDYIDNNRDRFEEMLNYDLWIDDSVTGNASGSYTFSTYEAEENIAHNWDLLEECAAEFGIEPIISVGYEHSAEYWDVSIRCYLLAECIAAALDELDDEIPCAEYEEMEDESDAIQTA